MSGFFVSFTRKPRLSASANVLDFFECPAFQEFPILQEFPVREFFIFPLFLELLHWLFPGSIAMAQSAP